MDTLLSIGAFPWIALVVSIVALRLRPAKRGRMVLSVVAFYVVLALVTAYATPGSPRVGPLLVVVLLHLSVIVTLLGLSGGLRIVWDARIPSAWPRVVRAGGAALFADIVPFVLVLPVLVLSFNLHRAPAPHPVGDGLMGLPTSRLTIEGADGVRLSAVWLEHPDPRGAVLLSHGLGAEKTQFLAVTRALVDRGYHVLSFDHRNHGESSGLTTTLGARESEDVKAAWRVLLDRTAGREHPREMTRLAFGISMGGAAVQLAAPSLSGLDGVIVDSTFADISVVAQKQAAASGFPGPLSYFALAIARLAVRPVAAAPVLSVRPVDAVRAGGAWPAAVLHSRRDPMIPFSEAEALVEAYAGRATLTDFDVPHHPNAHLAAPARYDAAVSALAERAERRAKR